MNKSDVENWSIDEMKGALSILLQDCTGESALDLSDCPPWVRGLGIEYLSAKTEGEDEDEVQGEVFQASEPYERRQKSKILARRFEAFRRSAWLAGDADPDLLQAYGSLAGVPPFLAKAARLRLENYYIKNLNGIARGMTRRERENFNRTCREISKTIKDSPEK